MGPTGVGKTHLAIGLTIEAIEQGNTAHHTRCDDFIQSCKKAEQRGTTGRLVNKLSTPDVLIIYQMGYFPFDDLRANLLFQISKRYEHGSIIITSNKSYDEWGKIFGDDVLATAVLDRLLHHSTTFNIKGQSYRLRKKQRAGVQPI